MSKIQKTQEAPMQPSPIILLTGSIAPLPGGDAQSGIVKTPVIRPLALGPEVFEGDEQADRRVHGGVE